MIQALQITDIHVSRATIGRVKERVAALIGSLQKLGAKPDIIIITGDLTQRGDASEYELFDENVVAHLVSGLEIERARIVVVPGNHDVDRNKVDPLIQAGLERYIGKPTMLDDFWRDPERRKSLLQRQEAFYSFCQAKQLQFFSKSIDICGVSVGIACLNSSWLSCSDSDRSNLAITRAQMEMSSKELSSSDLKIGVWHHPISWLHDSDASRVRAHAVSQYHLCLTGHLHEEDGVQISSPEGNTIFVSCPALHATGEKGGYMLFDIDTSTRTMLARGFRWNERAATFVRDTDFAENGTWSRSYDSIESISEKALAIRQKTCVAHLDDYQSRLSRHLPAIAVGKKELTVEQRFLEPNLISQNGSFEKKVRLQDLIQSTDSYILESLPQSGKTATLEHIGMRVSKAGKVAIVCDFARIRGYRASRQSMVDFLANELHQSKAAVKNMLAGELLLLVDNCILDHESSEWATMDCWRKEFSNLRVIAAGRPTSLPKSRDVLSASWKSLVLRPLSVQHVKKEIARLEKLGDPVVQSSQSIQTALYTIIDAELPRWPWVILLFFQITQRLGLTDLRSVEGLIRQYAELRMGAFESVSVDRLKARSRMLRLLATAMIEGQMSSTSKKEAIALFDAEIRKCGLDNDASELLKDLIGTQLLSENEDNISFTFFILQEFFHAEYLRESLWTEFENLDIDVVIRKSGALVLYAEMVQAPLLLKKCLALSLGLRREVSYEELIDSLAHLRISSGGSEEIIKKAKDAVLSQDEVEEYVNNREVNQQGSRARRLLNDNEEMDRLDKLIHGFATSVAVMRGSLWLDKSLKHESISASLDLAASIVAEVTAEDDLLRAIASREPDATRRRMVTAVVNALLVLIVANMLAVLGAGQHLAPTIVEMFKVEKQDLRRLMLMMWYVEIGGKISKAMVESFVQNAHHAFSVQLATTWLSARHIMSSSFGDSVKIKTDELLRTAAEEQARRSAKQDDSAVTIKAEAEKIIRAAKRVKDIHKYSKE